MPYTMCYLKTWQLNVILIEYSPVPNIWTFLCHCRSIPQIFPSFQKTLKSYVREETHLTGSPRSIYASLSHPFIKRAEFETKD